MTQPKNAFSGKKQTVMRDLTTLWADSVEDRLMIFCISSQKAGFYIACKLSPQETGDMQCQLPLSGEDKKNYFKMSSAEKFAQHA